MKELQVGQDYWTVFGDAAAPGQPRNQLIYMGGIKFRAINGTTGQVADRESQQTYNQVHEYINRPNVKIVG